MNFPSIYRHLVASLLLLTASASFTQVAGKPASTAEPGITREQADQILQELRQIRRLLENGATAQRSPATPQTPQHGKVNIAGLPVLGRVDAPLTIVEFSDYQCPFCRAFQTSIFVELKKNWIDTGKARFISWDLPLSIHSNAAKAAQAARCSAEQNKFWELRSMLVANATKLTVDDILGYARQVPGLDADRFQKCLQSEKYVEQIKAAGTVANGQGITGTPTFIIANTAGDLVDGTILLGAPSYDVFENELKNRWK